MGAYEKDFSYDSQSNGNGIGIVPELVEWFGVSGDMDDFIYFGEETTCSER